MYPKVTIDELKHDKRLTGVSDVALKILKNRGFDTPEKIENFLFGDLSKLHDTRLMKDAELAVSIIKESIEYKEKTVVYGDYDADGVGATTVMADLVRKAGGTVDFYTNNRFTQGYGMMPSGVDAILEMHPDVKLIITVDNGIMANEGIDYAKKHGIKVVVTDHHEQGDVLPDADAIVDPKRHDCEYPFKGLCGAGVAFKLMLLLYWEMGLSLDTVYETLDIVGLCTVGDIVPLVDENRILVSKGLELLAKEDIRPVFSCFKEITGVTSITSQTFGFIFVPMINAIGRLDGDPRRAIEMFFEEDMEKISETVSYLKELNDTRKKMTVEMVETAENMLIEKGLKSVIVVYDESFHEGIVGLIAGRLKEKYNRPVIAFTKDHSGLLKGSARSIDNFHLKESFSVVKDHMVGGGGHAKAAGLSIKPEQLEGFEREMNKLADKWLTEEDFIKKYKVDYMIDACKVDQSIVRELNELEPFGESFPKPILLLDNFEVSKPFYMGTEKQHLKLLHDNISMIAWSGKEQYQRFGEPLHVKALGYPTLNIYNNNVSLQFMVDNDNFIEAKPKKQIREKLERVR